MKLRLLLLGLFTLGLFGLLALGWLVVVYPSERGPGRGKVVALELEAHDSLERIGHVLAAEGLVARPRVFVLYARVLGARERLRRGRVLVVDTMNMRQLLQRIASGFGATELRITIPEGFSRFDIAERLAEWGVCEREAFLRASENPDLLLDLDEGARTTEGYLFPDTYQLRDEMDPEQAIERLVRNARKRLSSLEQSEAAAFSRLREEFGFTRREVVTLASIVEKEARRPSEQPVIAGVFLNRLRDPAFRPKRLQADPTVAYGCRVLPALSSCQGFDGRRITRAMLADPQNPYNTYRLEGLPPGPIANPGMSALRAVLHPAQHDYYYFVARQDGSHAFSPTLEAHNRAVQEPTRP